MPADPVKKKCRACGQDKPLEEFHARDKNCGSCRATIVRTAAANNRRRAQVLAQRAKEGSP